MSDYKIGFLGFTQCNLPQQVATMANSLYHSLKRQYFVGYADKIHFEKNKHAWAALVNPSDSGVNLFVNVWTLTDFNAPPIEIQLWLNAELPGSAEHSEFVTPTNTAAKPLAEPKVKIMKASAVKHKPCRGAVAYGRLSNPEQTLADEEDGKFIIPPGGNFAIFLSNTEGVEASKNVQVAFGWWEERICDN